MKPWDGINKVFNGQPIKRAEYIIKLGRIPNPDVIVILHSEFWNATNNIRLAITAQYK